MKQFVEAFYVWYRKTLRHAKYRWLLIGGTLLYLLSPIDISPDFIPIVGWIDDGLIATVLVTEVSQLLLEQFNRRKGTKVATNEGTPEGMPEVVVDVKAEPTGKA